MIIIVLDQFLKYIVSYNMDFFESIRVIPNFFHITYVTNTGAAFSMFQNGRWFFVILGIIAVIAIIRYIYLENKIRKSEALAYALLIGGITGNLIDRVVFGYVIDFFDFYILGYDAPIFNIADTSIVIGAVIIIYNIVFIGDKDENNNGRRRVK